MMWLRGPRNYVIWLIKLQFEVLLRHLLLSIELHGDYFYLYAAHELILFVKMWPSNEFELKTPDLSLFKNRVYKDLSN
jgi:hypothetical protein